MREIFEVYAKIVDSNGAYSTLSGYPKSFDTNNYDGDLEKTTNRAYSEWYAALSAMGKRDDRQIQFAMIIRASDGLQIECKKYGGFPPDPEPEPPEQET